MTPNEFLSMIAQLRRERDKARHEIEGLKNKWNSAVTMAARAENERDEAIRKQDETNRSSKYACDYHYEEKLKAERERDEAREVATGLAVQAERLRKERDEAREQLRIAVGLLSTQPQFADKHPEDVLAFVKEGAK